VQSAAGIWALLRVRAFTRRSGQLPDREEEAPLRAELVGEMASGQPLR
jgi:hypothetical protein